ncbi:MAG TPA: hypothetical protein VFI30_03425 [Nocardioidaceae bacterium]|nr:hypothetical protein [Nocardioidaceae bacterium]
MVSITPPGLVRVDRHRQAGVWVGVDPPDPDPGLRRATARTGPAVIGRVPPAQQVAGDAGRHRAVAGHPGRVGGAAERGRVGHHQVDAHVRADRRVAPGDRADQRVGHQLPAPAGVPAHPGGVGRPAQRAPRADRVGDRQQRGQVGHGVGGRSDADPALALGVPGPGHHRGRVEAVGRPAGGRGHRPVPAPVQPPGQLGVYPGAVGGGQAGGLAGQHGGPPLAEPAGRQRRQRRQRLGHLVDQRGGQPEVAVAASRGVVAGQRHLRAHAATRAADGDRCPGPQRSARGLLDRGLPARPLARAVAVPVGVLGLEHDPNLPRTTDSSGSEEPLVDKEFRRCLTGPGRRLATGRLSRLGLDP